MQNIKVLSALILSIMLFSFTIYKEDKDLCKVNKYNGKYVFWMSEPIAEYEEVFTVKATFSGCSRQTSQCEEIAKEAIVQSSLSKIEFDAVIVGATERDVAIKFKNPMDDKSIGKVKRVNGVPVFIDCVPVNNFVQEKRLKKFRIVGNKCFSSLKISELITKKGAKNDALLIGDDHYHWWINIE